MERSTHLEWVLGRALGHGYDYDDGISYIPEKVDALVGHRIVHITCVTAKVDFILVHTYI
jgi:hypothetical protein